MIFNPLNEQLPDVVESTSALIHDTHGVCPKCKAPFGNAIVAGDMVCFCERCRVSQPMISQ